jgi:hypothetical protein
MLNQAAKDFLTVDELSKKERRKEIFRMLLRHRPVWRVGRDMIDAVRAFW